ncbi:hypothetical protein EON65_55955, partial [archaeon]
MTYAVGDYSKFVRKSLNLSIEHVLDCEDSCRQDKLCQSFHVSFHNNTATNTTYYMCHTLSPEFHRLVVATSNPLLQSNLSTCYGQKAPAVPSPQTDNRITHQSNPLLPPSSNKTDPSQEHDEYTQYMLVQDPVVVLSYSLLTFPVHLRMGCEYTIAFHVWLSPWNYTLSRSSLYNVLHSQKIVYDDQLNSAVYSDALLPSVLYNVGEGQDKHKFFFAPRQRVHGDFLGFWRGDVRFGEWIHISMSFDQHKMTVYIDGKYVDYLT